MTSAPLRKIMLAEGAKLVPKYGIHDDALMALSMNALKGNPVYEKAKSMNRLHLSSMFSRGFSAAVVEHIVENSNRIVHSRLNERFDKFCILSAVARDEGNYKVGCYKPPSVGDVVGEAMISKFNALLPYCEHWGEAVALECLPSNAPFAAKLTLEFVDTTCYYAERVRNLASVTEASNILLRGRLPDPFTTYSCPSGVAGHVGKGENDDALWRNFASNVPLSSGPHIGEWLLGCDWYVLRMKVCTIFGLGMLSFLGDKSPSRLETKQMVQSIVGKLL